MLKYYALSGEEITIKSLKQFYENSVVLIISGLTNSGKETLAKLLDNTDYGKVSYNDSFHTFDDNKIAIIHAQNIESAIIIYQQIVTKGKEANHIHIQRDNGKFLLELKKLIP